MLYYDRLTNEPFVNFNVTCIRLLDDTRNLLYLPNKVKSEIIQGVPDLIRIIPDSFGIFLLVRTRISFLKKFGLPISSKNLIKIYNNLIHAKSRIVLRHSI